MESINQERMLHLMEKASQVRRKGEVYTFFNPLTREWTIANHHMKEYDTYVCDAMVNTLQQAIDKFKEMVKSLSDTVNPLECRY